MLGWALKKGFQGATGANDASGAGEDTTQCEVPDTPAPVFAARAFKNALFGARNSSEATKSTEQKHAEPAKKNNRVTPDNMASPSKQSPNKQPTSILLTPGTGTARRKRVSFNHDVKAGSGVDSSPLASAQHRKSSSLRRALENSRSSKSKKSAKNVEEEVPSKAAKNESDDEWEDDVYNHDVTVDLNEPHSESGKYWKEEFNRYRKEAVVNIEQLVKYKAMAKSYAKKKDAEAIELAQKLKEEQLKVAKMEENMAAMAAQIADKKKHGNGSQHATLLKDLAKQTDLAAHYRDQVKGLEALLKEQEDECGSNRSDRRRINTSPKTEKTLLEVNRELRRARSELKQMDKLREENKKLKSNLNAAEERAQKYYDDSIHKGAVDLVQVKRLEAQLRVAKEASEKKDDEIHKLKKDYESLKKDAKSRTAEALQVLQDKNDKIAALEKIIKELEAANSGKATRDLMASIESLSKPSKYDEAKPTRHAKRSASVEDINLDLTQKSLLGNEGVAKMDSTSEKVKPESFLPSDWSDSFKEIKNQLKKDQKEQMAANKKERDSIMEDYDPPQPRSITRAKPSLLSFDSGRAMSTVLSSRLNRSPNRSPTRASTAHLTPKELLDQKLAEARAATRADRVDKNAERFDAPNRATPRSARPRSYADRPQSSGSETPGFDLVQDHFARLGGPEPERNSSVNSSRCTLPPDRLAAARARIEQKKLKRDMNGRGRSRDKENVKP